MIGITDWTGTANTTDPTTEVIMTAAIQTDTTIRRYNKMDSILNIFYNKLSYNICKLTLIKYLLKINLNKFTIILQFLMTQIISLYFIPVAVSIKRY